MHTPWLPAWTTGAESRSNMIQSPCRSSKRPSRDSTQALPRSWMNTDGRLAGTAAPPRRDSPRQMSSEAGVPALIWSWRPRSAQATSCIALHHGLPEQGGGCAVSGAMASGKSGEILANSCRKPGPKELRILFPEEIQPLGNPGLELDQPFGVVQERNVGTV